MDNIKIRVMTMEDMKTWECFAHENSDEVVKRLVPDISVFYEGFDVYMEAKIKKNEAYMAVDEASTNCVGIVAFSKNYNRITFLGVSEQADFEAVGLRLLDLAFEQLDCSKDITANVLLGDFEPLIKERKLLRKYGFVEVDATIYEAGVPACMMKRTAVKRNE